MVCALWGGVARLGHSYAMLCTIWNYQFVFNPFRELAITYHLEGILTFQGGGGVHPHPTVGTQEALARAISTPLGGGGGMLRRAVGPGGQKYLRPLRGVALAMKDEALPLLPPIPSLRSLTPPRRGVWGELYRA